MDGGSLGRNGDRLPGVAQEAAAAGWELEDAVEDEEESEAPAPVLAGAADSEDEPAWLDELLDDEVEAPEVAESVE